MSDTPKTDSAEWQITRRFTNEEVMVVTVDFARQLERELAAVTRERDEFQRMAGANGLAGLEVGRENDALRAEVERLQALVVQARDDALEEAAKVCETRGAQFYPESPFFVEIHALSEGIRARIAGRKA